MIYYNGSRWPKTVYLLITNQLAYGLETGFAIAADFSTLTENIIYHDTSFLNNLTPANLKRSSVIVLIDKPVYLAENCGCTLRVGAMFGWLK